jgi:hypothetical protein
MLSSMPASGASREAHARLALTTRSAVIRASTWLPTWTAVMWSPSVATASTGAWVWTDAPCASDSRAVAPMSREDQTMPSGTANARAMWSAGPLIAATIVSGAISVASIPTDRHAARRAS